MDRLHALRVFRTVAEKGSFVKAADALTMSKSATSRAVVELEALLGVRLLQRSTRSIALTVEGAQVLEQSGVVLAAFDQMVSANRLNSTEATGNVRLNAPVSFGIRRLGPALAAFLARHPKVTIDLQLTDRQVDLIEENVDVALRIARDLSSTLIARRVATASIRAYASTTYVERHGRPHHPADLARHICLIYGAGTSAASDRAPWHFVNATTGEQVKVAVNGPLHANNGDVLVAAAANGAGIVLQPDFIVDASVPVPGVEALLPGWHAEPLGIYLVYGSRQYQTLRVRRLIDHLANELADNAPR